MLNKMTLIGYIGADPEFHAGNDRPQDRSNFSVAVTERWNSRTGGKEEHTEWFRCVAWGAVANIIADWGAKGMQVYIEGKIRTSEYMDKDGVKKNSMSVVVDRFLMLGKKGDSDKAAPAKKKHSPSMKPTANSQRDAYVAEDDLDDDIPF